MVLPEPYESNLGIEGNSRFFIPKIKGGRYINELTMENKIKNEFYELHVGELVKMELQRQGRSITWLASQISCTRENLYKVFRRPWIYTDLLFKICDALNHDFFLDCSNYYKGKKK